MGWAFVGGAGPTWRVTLYDGQVVQLEGRIASAAGEPNYVVLPVIDELGALLNVDVISAHIKDYSNVAFVLRGRGDKSIMMDVTLRQGYCFFKSSFITLNANS